MLRSLRIFSVALLALISMPHAHANELQLGQAAPVATLVTLDGRHLRTDTLRGHTLILTFWASWCEPCQHELPLLSRYAAAHREQGLMVLGFSLDDSEDLDKVRAIAKQLQFPVGLLNQSTVHGYGRMWRIPVSFVIDRNGILRYDGWKAEQPAWTDASLKTLVDPLLTQANSAGVGQAMVTKK